MKYFLIILIILFNINFSYSAQKDKAYFAGGCFWCMEESFENLSGVEEVISGYSGGVTENPTYKEVTYGNNMFVTVGASGTILTSSDGIDWTEITSGSTFTLNGVTAIR